MGVPVLALFRENKICKSQFYCHSRNLNPSKIMYSYTLVCYYTCASVLMVNLEEAC